MAKTEIRGAQIKDTDITASDIADKAVTLAKMNDLAQNTIIGRITGSSGVPEALTAANVRTIIGASSGGGLNADMVDGKHAADFISTVVASGSILVGNASNAATVVAVSGDAALSNAGVLAVSKTRLDVRNETGSTIVSTRAVYASGFNNYPLITLADNTVESKHNVIGVTIAPIATSANGFIATNGICDAETNAWTVGTELYLSTAGTLSSTEPTAGAVIHVGIVMVQANYPTGKMLLYNLPEGNTVAVGSAQDVIVRMGDSIGAKKVSFRDYANTEVASINSDGQITSAIATGTAPFVVSSTTKVNNLAVAKADTALAVDSGNGSGLYETLTYGAYDALDTYLTSVRSVIGDTAKLILAAIDAGNQSDITLYNGTIIAENNGGHSVKFGINKTPTIALDVLGGGALTEDLSVSNLTGWNSPNETWTRASATTFTISGDKTAKYRKGMKIKLTDTTVKYFYIIGVSYSSPNTTITVTGGSTYSLVGTISSPYFSRDNTPIGFPDWFNWSPTITGYSSNPTNVSYRFRISDTTCFVSIREITNGTSNLTWTRYTLPVIPATVTNMVWLYPCAYVDNGTASTTYGRGVISSASDTLIMGINASTPDGFTNSGGKRISSFTGWYEI